MKGKTEITAEAFLRRKRIHEERMRTWKQKTEKKERGKLERQKHAERGKGWGKIWRKIKQNKELEEEKNKAL